MNLHNALLDMEPVISRLTAGVEAVHLAALGLEQLQSPCPNGLFAIYGYLRDAQMELTALYDGALEAMRAQGRWRPGTAPAGRRWSPGCPPAG